MTRRLKRLLDWAVFHALGPTFHSGLVTDEQQARITLYSTSRRSVTAAPTKRPRVVSATAARDIEGEFDDHRT